MNKLTKRNQLDIGLHFNSCNNEISNQKNIDNECLVIVYYVGSQSLAFITNHIDMVHTNPFLTFTT